MMLRVLRFKRHLSPRVLDGERVFLLGGADPVLLRGRGFALVAPLVDGRRTNAEIVEALSGQASPPELLFALIMLEQRGHVVAATGALAPEIAAFLEAEGLDASVAEERLASAPVQVVGPSAHAPAVASALRGAGVQLAEQASLQVVVVEDYLDPSLEALNRRALEQGSSFTLLQPAGREAWVGPVLRPGRGPCWACMARRLRINRPVEVYLERRGVAAPSPVRPALPAAVQAGASLAALAIARWIAAGERGALDDLLTIDLSNPSQRRHPVVRNPACPACGDPGLATARARAPVALESRPKRFTDDGGHRAVAPEETWARLEKHVSPITGVVTSVGPIPERDHPLRPVYGSAFRLCPAHAEPAFDDFHRLAMGKGRTPAQARASAVCEAIERRHLVFQGDEPRRRARIGELEGEGLSPDALQNFSEAQFERRDETNARVAGLALDTNQLVPLPFDPDVPIDWTAVWSLPHGRRRWVPTAYCYTNMDVPPEERFCYANPNGHAAGNHLEEAILQAFLELTERDAVAIWWYNRLRRPAVDLESFEEPYFRDLLAHYRSVGYRVWVLDITTDLGIPAFAAVGLPEKDGRWHMGFGCHLEARLGVQRALTELNQLFDPSHEAPSPWDPKELTTTSFLYGDEALPARRKADFPATRSTDLRDDVLDCVARAERAGLETLVLDQSRPDVELYTVKVIVPGLRHFWPRFGPGRLYDVPVAMGLRDRPLAESELNLSPLKF
jgi:ribosomal protein S12 methylthiotransferase accessory factor